MAPDCSASHSTGSPARNPRPFLTVKLAPTQGLRPTEQRKRRTFRSAFVLCLVLLAVSQWLPGPTARHSWPFLPFLPPP